MAELRKIETDYEALQKQMAADKKEHVKVKAQHEASLAKVKELQAKLDGKPIATPQTQAQALVEEESKSENKNKLEHPDGDYKGDYEDGLPHRKGTMIYKQDDD
jgi:hypothetical protein